VSVQHHTPNPVCASGVRRSKTGTAGEAAGGQRRMAAAVCRSLRRGCGLAQQQPLSRWGGLAAATVGGSRAFYGDQNIKPPRLTRESEERTAGRRPPNLAMAGTMASGRAGLVFSTVDEYNQYMQMQLSRSMELGGSHRVFLAYVHLHKPPPALRCCMFFRPAALPST
jgi:hypothetical protein